MFKFDLPFADESARMTFMEYLATSMIKDPTGIAFCKHMDSLIMRDVEMMMNDPEFQRQMEESLDADPGIVDKETEEVMRDIGIDDFVINKMKEFDDDDTL